MNLTKLIVILAVALGGYWCYKTYFYKSETYKVYEQFIEAYGKGDCKGMYAVADGAAKEFVDQLCASHSITVYGVTSETPSAASQISDMAATPASAMMKVRREVESEESSADGAQVTLKVIEKVLGRRTALIRPRDPVRHTVKLKLVGENWKVMEFAQQDLPQP